MENQQVPVAGAKFTALSYYCDIAGMGQYDHYLILPFRMNSDGSASLDSNGIGLEGTLPAETVRRLFETGGSGGLSSNCSLSEPKVV